METLRSESWVAVIRTYSLLTSKRELGMDNIVGFQVLTPSVTTQFQDLSSSAIIYNVNLKENLDLFKALKV